MLRFTSTLLLVSTMACVGTDTPTDITDETDGTVVEGCEGGGDITVALGKGAGDEFVEFEENEEVELQIASQGGFGVGVRLLTSGLVGDEAVDVLLETELQDSVSGSYLAEGARLYCQGDGVGLLWGVTVGLDPDEFSDPDDLLALDGDSVTLSVEVTDINGSVGVGSTTVTMRVGAK
jgi:hypothetical protein